MLVHFNWLYSCSHCKPARFPDEHNCNCPSLVVGMVTVKGSAYFNTSGGSFPVRFSKTIFSFDLMVFEFKLKFNFN